MKDPEIIAARAKAAAAQAEMQATLRELQARLRPANLASDAIDGLKRKGEAVAGDAADAVRARPVAAGAAVAGLGALIGARLFLKYRSRGETA